MPDLSHETSYHPHTVCGIDEAGRGPWAGPVVAACVIIPPNAHSNLILQLNDSKKLSASKRAQLFEHISANFICGVGNASAAEIDALNIWKATELAMQRAFEAAGGATVALVDGNRAPLLPCTVKTIIKGDSISASIAAASIIAKVTRDRIMESLDAIYPAYGFSKHAGYGTAQHSTALKKHGPSPEHRQSFAPIRTLHSEEAA